MLARRELLTPVILTSSRRVFFIEGELIARGGMSEARRLAFNRAGWRISVVICDNAHSHNTGSLDRSEPWLTSSARAKKEMIGMRWRRRRRWALNRGSSSYNNILKSYDSTLSFRNYNHPGKSLYLRSMLVHSCWCISADTCISFFFLETVALTWTLPKAERLC